MHLELTINQFDDISLKSDLQGWSSSKNMSPQMHAPTARGRPPVKVDLEALQTMFDRPQPAAAHSLGISLTSLKLVCRRLGLSRWPYKRAHYNHNTLQMNTAARTESPREAQAPSDATCPISNVRLASTHSENDSVPRPIALPSFVMTGPCGSFEGRPIVQPMVAVAQMACQHLLQPTVHLPVHPHMVSQLQQQLALGDERIKEMLSSLASKPKLATHAPLPITIPATNSPSASCFNGSVFDAVSLNQGSMGFNAAQGSSGIKAVGSSEDLVAKLLFEITANSKPAESPSSTRPSELATWKLVPAAEYNDARTRDQDSALDTRLSLPFTSHNIFSTTVGAKLDRQALEEKDIVEAAHSLAEPVTQTNHTQSRQIKKTMPHVRASSGLAKGRPSSQVDLACLKAKFNYPHVKISQPAAAKELGISLTTLKQVCRKMGVSRWPYRRSGAAPGRHAVDLQSSDDASDDTTVFSTDDTSKRTYSPVSPPRAAALFETAQWEATVAPSLLLPPTTSIAEVHSCHAPHIPNQGDAFAVARNIIALQNSIAAMQRAMLAGTGGCDFVMHSSASALYLPVFSGTTR